MTPGAHRFAPTPLPEAARGRWIAVRTVAVPGLVAAFVEPLDAAGRLLAEPVAAWRWRGGGLAAVLFVGDEVGALGLLGMGTGLDGAAAHARAAPLQVRPIGSWHAAIRLFVRRPTALATVLGRGVVRPAALKARVRAAQAALLAPHGRKLPYPRWVALFGPDGAGTAPVGVDAAPAATIRGALVFAATGDGAALGATRRALARAGVPYGIAGPTGADRSRPGGANRRPVAAGDDRRRVAGDADWRRVAATLDAGPDEYVAVLQAGEIPPAALRAVAGRMLEDAGRPALAFADTDRIDGRGRRSGPEFRAVPDHALMLSGTTARGLWLVRADVLAAHADAPGEAAAWAELLRLELWCTHRERGLDAAVARLPVLLSSRRDDAEAAPPALLARAVDAHLDRSGIALRTVPDRVPIRLLPRAEAPRPPVTMIIPSTLIAPHSERCIEAVLSGTAWPSLEVIVAVGGPGGPGGGSGGSGADGGVDDAVAAAAARLEARHGGLRVRRYPAAGFNFAWTVNRALAEARGELVLLLNDDVRPIEPDWLVRMAAWLTDARVGAVGARLLYPDGTIQHAGVVMGGDDICAHAFRGLPGDASGHGGRAQLPGCWSALTGACLLLRAGALRALGGLDEDYPSAFNDIDLCLRLGERGASVVLSDATLVHEELQTFGSHWGRLGPALQRSAVERMRARWGATIDADPWFSPNLDLGATVDWREAWPPRSGVRVVGG